MVIQSKYFANVLKNIIVRYVPSNLGVNLDFKDLNILFFPPGIVVNKPKLTLNKENALSLPDSSSLEFDRLEATFQFFQLMTGTININAFIIHGADLTLNLEKDFIDSLQSAQARQKKSKSDHNWWDKLLSFNFRSVGIVDSKVNIMFKSLIAGKPVRIRGDARELTVSRGTRDSQASYDLSLDIGNAQLEAEKYQHKLTTFRASVEIFEKGAQIRSVSLQEGEITLHCGGAIKGNITNPKTLPVDLDILIMGPLREWMSDGVLGAHITIPYKDTLSGQIKMESHLTGDLLNILETYELRANVEVKDFTYDRWVSKEATVSLKSKKNSLDIEQILIKFIDGSIKASKSIFSLNKAPYLQSATIELDNVDIRQALGRAIEYIYPVNLKASGNIVVTGDKDLADTIHVNPTLSVKDFVLDNQTPKKRRDYKKIIEITQGKISSGQVIIDPRKVQFSGVKADFDRSNLGLDGTINFKSGFDLSISGRVDLDDMKHISGIPISGKGPLKWTVQGPAENIVLGFDYSLSDAEFLNFKLGEAVGKMALHDGKDYFSLDSIRAKLGNMELVGSGGLSLKSNEELVQLKANVVKGSCLDFNAFMGHYLKNISWYPYEMTCDLSGEVVITGKPDEKEIVVEADTYLRNVDYRGEIFNEGTMLAGLRKGKFFAERINLRKKSGTIKGSVYYDVDETVTISLTTSDMTTADLDTLSRLGIPYSAPINSKVQLAGKWGQLQGNAVISTGYGSVRNLSVAPSEYILQAMNGRYLMSLNLFGGQAVASTEWGQVWPSDGRITIDAAKLDLMPILASINPQILEDNSVEASLSTSVDVKFNTSHLSKLTGRIAVNQFKLQKRGSRLQLLSPVEFSIANGDYNFGKIRILGDGTEMSVVGAVQSGNIQYTATGDLPLSLFEFVTPEIPVFRGAVSFNAIVSGRADSPEFSAKGRFTGADLRLAKIEQYFEGITGIIYWKNDEILFNDLFAKFGGGTVTGKGRAIVRLTRSPALDFSFNLRNPKFKVYPFSYIRMNGLINVKADAMPYLASGNIDIAEALVQQNFSAADGKASRSSAFFPSSGADATSDIHLFNMDLMVDGDRDIFVKNDLFDAQLKGKLKIMGTAESPKILGTIEVLQGKMFFNENVFTINTGLVKFTNPAVIDPEFDMTATIDHKGYKVNLYASGKPSDPKITFRSQPPLSQQDIVTLLTLGMTSSGYQSLRSQDRDAYSRDEVYSLLFSQSGVSKGLKNKFGVNVGVDQAVNANVAESAFRRSNDANLNVAPKVVLQKEIVKNLNAKVGSTVGVGDSRQQDLNIEYQFGRNASVQGVYEDQRGSTPRNSRTSMGVDLKFRWNFK
jgi:translocation and assembly module TamB